MPLRISLLALGLFLTSVVLAADSGSVSPRDLQYDPAAHEIRKEQLPEAMAKELVKASEDFKAKQKAAQKDILAFLRAETNGDAKTAFYLIAKEIREDFPRNSHNMAAIIKDIKLYRNPPKEPTNLERENMDRVAWLVEHHKLSLDIDDPVLWAYEFVHGTYSLDAVFANTGPYTYNYKLLNYKLIRVTPTQDGRVVAWVDEELRMPGSIVVAQLAQYRLVFEEGRWKVWSYISKDGPYLLNWIGQPTYIWPEDLAARVGINWDPWKQTAQ